MHIAERIPVTRGMPEPRAGLWGRASSLESSQSPGRWPGKLTFTPQRSGCQEVSPQRDITHAASCCFASTHLFPDLFSLLLHLLCTLRCLLLPGELHHQAPDLRQWEAQADLREGGESGGGTSFLLSPCSTISQGPFLTGCQSHRSTPPPPCPFSS